MENKIRTQLVHVRCVFAALLHLNKHNGWIGRWTLWQVNRQLSILKDSYHHSSKCFSYAVIQFHLISFIQQKIFFTGYLCCSSYLCVYCIQYVNQFVPLLNPDHILITTREYGKKEQFGFLKGRQIIDAIGTAQECLNNGISFQKLAYLQ